MAKLSAFLLIICMQLVNAMYIKPTVEPKKTPNAKPSAIGNTANTENDWSVYKRKLGLTDEKVELLKQQKDQHATLDLLNRFIKENPKYTIETPGAASVAKTTDPFIKLYRSLLKNHKISKSTMKTSFNFELGEQSKKSHKRPRRKIAVRMVSDMPNEKIDDLLKMFTAQHGIDDPESDVEQQADDYDVDDVDDYKDHSMVLPTALNPDYMYENLYEDEEDLEAPTRSHSNSEYGSFQDLILQANRNQWRRQFEETKLRSQDNDHFALE